jgi:hypothetical protein
MKTRSTRRGDPVYYVNATARTSAPVDDDRIAALMAAMKYCDIMVGGGEPAKDLDGSFYLRARDLETAIEDGLAMWREGLSRAGLSEHPTVRFDVQDEQSLEAEAARPLLPPLAGVGELAELLGVSRQRASVIARSKGFPEPLADLAAGPVFSKWAIEAFAERWERKSGRPRKEPA